MTSAALQGLLRALQTAEELRQQRNSPALVALGVACLGTLAIVSQQPLLVPLLLTAAVFPFLLLDLRAGDLRRAALHLAVFVAATLGLGLLWSLCAPGWLVTAVPEAGFHHWETARLIGTGTGHAARPEDFITDRALDYVYVSAGSVFGAGLAPLLMGSTALLVDAHLWARLVSDSPSAAAIALGFPPWQLLGYAGYLLLVLGWGEVTGATVGARPIQWRRTAKLVAAATVLLALQVVVQLLMVDLWKSWLGGTV